MNITPNSAQRRADRCKNSNSRTVSQTPSEPKDTVSLSGSGITTFEHVGMTALQAGFTAVPIFGIGGHISGALDSVGAPDSVTASAVGGMVANLAGSVSMLYGISNNNPTATNIGYGLLAASGAAGGYHTYQTL